MNLIHMLSINFQSKKVCSVKKGKEEIKVTNLNTNQLISINMKIAEQSRKELKNRLNAKSLT